MLPGGWLEVGIVFPNRCTDAVGSEVPRERMNVRVKRVL